MIELLNNFHFLRPLWLLSLLPMLAIFVVILRFESRRSAWQSLIDTRFLNKLAQGQGGASQRWPLYALALIWLIGCFAIAGPTWTEKPLPVQKGKSAQVILWDLSPSMNASDLSPSRVVRSRLKIIDLLKQQKSQLSALIAYSGDAHVVTPLTDDIDTIVNLAASLHPDMMPARGSNIEAALELAHQTLKESGILEGHILIVTDGIDPSAHSRLKKIQRDSLHEIIIWGVGTQAGAPIPLADGSYARRSSGEIVMANLDEAALSDISSKLGGVYIPFSESDFDISHISTIISSESPLEKNDRESMKKFDTWVEYGPYFLLAALLLCASLFRKGWVLPCLCVFSFSYSDQSLASGLQSFIFSDDQRAMKAFKNGDAQTAAELFQDPDWRAAAQYKSGELDKAEAYYQSLDSAEAAFNLGNVYAKKRQYQQAIAAYDAALEKNPNNQAAKKNKELIETLLQKQEQDQNQQGENSDQNGEQNQNGEQSDGQNSSSQENNSDGQQQSDSQQGQNGEQQSSSEQNQSAQNGEQGESSDEQSNVSEEDAQSSNASDEAQKALEDFYNQNDNAEKQEAEEGAEAKAESDSDKSDQDQQQAQSQQQDANSQQEQSEEAEERSTMQGQSKAQQAAEGNEGSDEEQAVVAQYAEQEERLSEADQALEQWLRKVPDDPSGLLRNKFNLQHQENLRKRGQRSSQRAPNQEQRW